MPATSIHALAAIAALILAIATPAAAATVPTPDHVVVVMEENHGYGEIIGSAQAPYINQLAGQGASFTQSYALSHPSLPNYLQLFSGSNQGVTDDSEPHSFTSSNLGAALIAKGRTFIGYAEGLPAVGSLATYTGNYDRDHCPWTQWQGAASNGIPAADNHPFSDFPSDFTTLPTVAFVTPDLTHIMHDSDGTIAAGDAWLHDHLDAYAQWAKTHNSLLVLRWDEDDGSDSNRVAFILVGGPVKVGSYAEHNDHYSVLRTIEDMYGLVHSGAAATATPITDCWTTSAPTAPAITAQPQGTSVSVGQTATFSVTASGGAPLSYQWQRGGATIAGATAASYTTPATAAVDNGASFRVVVSNSAGSITSSTAILTVTAAATAPSITAQPHDASVVTGQTATFSVTATGTAPLTYQWQRGGTSIAGAMSASYTTLATTAADNGAAYRVVVSNAAGSVTSSIAHLTILVPPAITAQPRSASVAVGQPATFSVTASGTAPLTYQWQRGGTSIAGATSASYTTPAVAAGDDGALYRVVVANAGGRLTSTAATLTVSGAAPAGPVTPLHYAAGNNFAADGTYTPGAVGFNLADVGSVAELNSLPAGVKGLVWLGLNSGADAAFVQTVTPFIGNPKLFGFYLMDEPDPTGQWAPLTTPANLMAESDWIHAHVAGAKTFIVMMDLGSFDAPSFANSYTPANTHIDLFGLDPYPCRTTLANPDYALINRTVAAALSAGIPLAAIVPVYQTFGLGDWSDNLGGKYAMPTADQERQILATWGALTPTPAFDYAYAWGSQQNDLSLEGSAALKAVFAAHNAAVAATAPTITAQPQARSVTVGQTATFSVTASGSAPLSYQWQRGGTSIAGATSASYTTPATTAADNGASFRVVVSNSAGSVISSAATLTVTAAGGLPGGWATHDVGTVSVVGSASFANGSWSVKGSGIDIWGSADSFQFTAMPLTSDGQIVARVASQVRTDGWANAGVMIRETLATGSRHAMAMITPDYGVDFVRRLNPGGASAATSGSAVKAPYWLKLVRVGTTFTAYQSADGVTWREIGAATIAMGASAYIGLAVSAHDDGAGLLSTAVFDHVTVTAGPGGSG